MASNSNLRAQIPTCWVPHQRRRIHSTSVQMWSTGCAAGTKLNLQSEFLTMIWLYWPLVECGVFYAIRANELRPH